MGTRKNEPIEKKVIKLGVVRDIDFPQMCCANVSLNQTDYSRILEVLRQYVAQDFPEDDAYNDALKVVCSKLKRKKHRLIMLGEIFVGTGKVILDHYSGKEHTITVKK